MSSGNEAGVDEEADGNAALPREGTHRGWHTVSDNNRLLELCCGADGARKARALPLITEETVFSDSE